MSEIHEYTVNLKWKSDRKGEISSPELPTTIEVATPPDFPNGMPDIWSPEHLFVAAVNTCLMTTFLAIAENSNLEFISFKCKSVGVLDKIDGKFQVSKITLKPELIIPEGTNEERAQRILEKSEQHCLISNSIKTNIILEPKIIVQQRTASM
ncbi:OsmC family protein [Gillisia limnaea]|uniref:OsmC family protein n=1 Tax=Gillisia limnaea (strain DSM 15749 / LMG 21470 / R-8282) TaxID=865937 RepID=H2C093_GILLR|nr:OsmC family protein [Gillisia limnaea]EHQ03509.1 OsmC family protein [Gillisia limnaea DSM 15749]